MTSIDMSPHGDDTGSLEALHALNALLDGPGESDGEALQTAFDKILPLAKANPEHQGILDVLERLQALTPQLHGLDLRTYEGWCAGATALLAGKPSNTALVDECYHGCLMVVDGTLLALPDPEGDLVPVPTEWGYPVNATEVDRSAWNGITGCWDGEDQQAPRTD